MANWIWFWREIIHGRELNSTIKANHGQAYLGDGKGNFTYLPQPQMD
jgi:hypothetical protein